MAGDRPWATSGPATQFWCLFFAFHSAIFPHQPGSSWAVSTSADILREHLTLSKWPGSWGRGAHDPHKEPGLSKAEPHLLRPQTALSVLMAWFL
jgi:hypothetical protein